MMFMLALAQATAAGTLVAQHLGAGEPETARRVAAMRWCWPRWWRAWWARWRRCCASPSWRSHA